MDRLKEYYDAGVRYYKAGEYEKAISEFEKIQLVKPGHEQSIKMIRKCREKLGIK